MAAVKSETAFFLQKYFVVICHHHQLLVELSLNLITNFTEKTFARFGDRICSKVINTRSTFCLISTTPFYKMRPQILITEVAKY